MDDLDDPANAGESGESMEICGKKFEPRRGDTNDRMHVYCTRIYRAAATRLISLFHYFPVAPSPRLRRGLVTTGYYRPALTRLRPVLTRLRGVPSPRACRISRMSEKDLPRMAVKARRRKVLKKSFPCPKWKEPGATRLQAIDLVAPPGEIIPALETGLGPSSYISTDPPEAWLNLKQLREPILWHASSSIQAREHP